MRPARFAFLENTGTLAFAHRGGALEAPENTMTAFRYAVELGFRYLETDVYATRDGAVVAFHDYRLDRVTDRKGPIEGLTLADIRAARIGGTEPIPLLSDILEAWPDVRINIDAKHDAAVDPLIRVLKAMNVQDRVCVAAFSDKRIARVLRAFDGRICTALGPKSTLRLKAAAMGFPVGRFVGGCAQVPWKLHGRTLVDRRFVAAAERYGLQVHVWTIDDADAMHALLDIGVHGLMTDRPRVLRDVLIRRGQWA